MPAHPSILSPLLVVCRAGFLCEAVRPKPIPDGNCWAGRSGDKSSGEQSQVCLCFRLRRRRPVHVIGLAATATGTVWLTLTGNRPQQQAQQQAQPGVWGLGSGLGVWGLSYASGHRCICIFCHLPALVGGVIRQCTMCCPHSRAE